MADQLLQRLAATPVAGPIATSPEMVRATALPPKAARLMIDPQFIPPRVAPPPVPPTPPPPPVPVSAPPTVPAHPTVPALPAAPVETPFDKLPFPSPGDRVKADDFKILSQCLKLLNDMFVLASSLFGRPYGEVRMLLGSRGYQIGRVVTVFGNEIVDLSDTSFDNRAVVQVLPAGPGQPVVMLVLAEAVDNRVFAPNLTGGINYTTALDQVRSVLGSVGQQGPPINTPQLVGLSLADAFKTIPQ
jgi:hypothetical protein